MRTLDISQLYLRITIGGMLILHNIGNMQNYNEIIGSYHEIDGMSRQFIFIMLSSFESVAAIMLIVGWRVRVAATILIVESLLTLLYFPSSSTLNLELKAIYIFLYIYVFIAGGGSYSLDRFRTKHKVIV